MHARSCGLEMLALGNMIRSEIDSADVRSSLEQPIHLIGLIESIAMTMTAFTRLPTWTGPVPEKINRYPLSSVIFVLMKKNERLTYTGT